MFVGEEEVVAKMVAAISLRWQDAKAGSGRLGESGRGEEEDAAMRRWRCCHVDFVPYLFRGLMHVGIQYDHKIV